MRGALLFAALSAIACKNPRLDDATAYERAACACAMGDVACAKAAKDTYDARIVGFIQKPASSQERVELERHREAARQCLSQAWSCGGSKSVACPAGYACVALADLRSDVQRQQCRKILHDGDACGGSSEGTCEPGLVCKAAQEMDPSRHCDPGPCMDEPSGTCGKP